MIVSSHETLEVADHDFCKFSLIPSVTLSLKIQKVIGIGEMSTLASKRNHHHLCRVAQLYTSRMNDRHILLCIHMVDLITDLLICRCNYPS